jgi:hypothetical protein
MLVTLRSSAAWATLKNVELFVEVVEVFVEVGIFATDLAVLA